MVTKTFTNTESESQDNFDSKKIELESLIQTIVEVDNASACTVHFDYRPGIGHYIDLSIITHNPIHGTDFLFHKSSGMTDEHALQNAYNYLIHHRSNESTFTIEWKKKDEAHTVVSYFSGDNMLDVLRKFYFNKNVDDFIVFSTKLNPLS